MTDINWPTMFLPGTTDNFVSNEVVTSKASLQDLWLNLQDTSKWEGYYDNASNIQLDDRNDNLLHFDEHFRFDTFGFPIDARVMELVTPEDAQIARISWHGWQNGDENTQFDVYHAFLLEQLDTDRVRLLTQESQIGKPAIDLARQSPNPMLNGHQAWLDGLVKASM